MFESSITVANNFTSGANTLDIQGFTTAPETIVCQQLLVKLLAHPWAPVERDEKILLQSLFNGNDNLKLGIPRYLNDQLMGKVLLNNKSNASIKFNNPYELGPPANDVRLMNIPLLTSPPGLLYWNKNTKKWEQVLTTQVNHCIATGKNRFDTKLVRNLTWFVQLQRIMRVVLTNHLSWIDTPVVRGLKIADPLITEYHSNDQFSNGDFNGDRYDVV